MRSTKSIVFQSILFLLVILSLGVGLLSYLAVKSLNEDLTTSNDKISKLQSQLPKEITGFESLDEDKYQAVFLKSGTGVANSLVDNVYFGKIQNASNATVELTNVYYLNGENQNSISLTKLGCELHGPEDKMVINRDDISFWENLKDDGQVVKAIKDFARANPQGQECPAPY